MNAAADVARVCQEYNCLRIDPGPPPLRLTTDQARLIAAHLRSALDVPADVEIIVDLASGPLGALTLAVGFERGGKALAYEEVGTRPVAYPMRMVPSTACVHEYPPGCPSGTTRCWLCNEPDALPPRQAGPNRAEE